MPSLALAFIDAEILERSFPASSCRTIPLGSSAGDRACLLMRGGGDARPVPAPADHAPLQLGCFPSRHPSTIGRDATRTIDVPEVLLEAVRSLEPERMTTIRGLPAHFSRAEAGHSSQAPKVNQRGKNRFALPSRRIAPDQDPSSSFRIRIRSPGVPIRKGSPLSARIRRKCSLSCVISQSGSAPNAPART